MENFGWILLGLFLLAKSGAGGSGQPLINPTQGSIMMGGSVGIPLLGAALNGLSRPLTGSFGLSVGGPQQDPVWGNVGVQAGQLGQPYAPGYNVGEIPNYSVPTGFDMGTPVMNDAGAWAPGANDVFSFDQLGV